jgi:outer membrane protein with beta-barrel domain
MFKTLMMALVIVACASIAAAQSDYKRFEFFGGYSHNRIDTGIGDDDPDLADVIDEREGFNGFNASATGNLSRYFGLKVDVSGHYKSRTIPIFTIASATGNADLNSSLYNFLGGVQIKDNSTESTFKPFAHALAGVAHARNRLDFTGGCVTIVPSPCPADFTDTDTGFAAALGGGLDIRASKSIDIRVIQVDYNPTRLFDSTQHNFRIGVGVVFH